jgi:hypothetical protein
VSIIKDMGLARNAHERKQEMLIQAIGIGLVWIIALGMAILSR